MTLVSKGPAKQSYSKLIVGQYIQLLYLFLTIITYSVYTSVCNFV